VGGTIALQSGGCAGTRELLVSSKPSVDTRLKSKAAAVIQNGLASW
jgi:hypothetical protein